MGPRLVKGIVVMAVVGACGLLLLPGCGRLLELVGPEPATSPVAAETGESGAPGDLGPLDRVLRWVADLIGGLWERGLLLLLLGLVVVFVVLLLALLLKSDEAKSQSRRSARSGVSELSVQASGSGTSELKSVQVVPSLILQTTASETRIFPVKADGFTIGREPDNDLVIDESAPRFDTVSRHHARLYHGAGHWVVEDLGSQNGVYINGRRTGRNVLEDGWTLGIGGVQLVFHAGTGEVPR